VILPLASLCLFALCPKAQEHPKESAKVFRNRRHLFPIHEIAVVAVGAHILPAFDSVLIEPVEGFRQLVT